MSGVAEVRARLTISADALAVRRVTAWLGKLLIPAGDEAVALQPRVELAVHEVCMNIVDHSYGPDRPPQHDDITVEGTVDEAAVWIWIWDRGGSFDFGSVRKPEPGVPQVRGYGLVIVEKLTDDLQYVRESNTNIWSMRFDRAGHRKAPR